MNLTAHAVPLMLLALPAAAQDPSAFFEKQIRPVFAAKCAQCHNSTLKTAGLDLTTSGGIVAAASGNRLVKAIGYEDKTKMPPSGKLPDVAIQDITTWVNSGAIVPDYKPLATPTAGVFSEARRSHWSYQPVRNVALPAVKQVAWAQSPIDRFILAKLEEKGLTPPKPADKGTLIRRAKYDLLGLPPTEDEIREFTSDNSPDAFAKVVDKFLASPHYGEKWGRHWLDVARYAESCGVDENDAYTEAWRYREYVIDAFNRDVPFNTFIREQVAGDLLPSGDGSPVNVRGRVATGFLALGPRPRLRWTN
ncbi:MAG: hypothetical protein QOJ99_3481 [Bryobacterales bacterium]|jgi:hypothetical protein|nr:hypothetical protein [Bryobacterales bacterium]